MLISTIQQIERKQIHVLSNKTVVQLKTYIQFTEFSKENTIISYLANMKFVKSKHTSIFSIEKPNFKLFSLFILS